LAEITPPLFVHAMFLPNPAGWSVSMSVHAQSLCSTVGRFFVSSISYLCTLRFLDQRLVLTPFWQYQASFSLSILPLGTLVAVFSYAGKTKTDKSMCQGTYVVLVVISTKFAMEFSMKFNQRLGQSWLK